MVTSRFARILWRIGWSSLCLLCLAPLRGAPADVEMRADHFRVATPGEAPFEGVLLKPAGAGPFPAILLSHGLGGRGEQMARQRGGEFVAAGYVVIAPDYAHANREGNRRDFGASAENLRRARKCLEILRADSTVDSRRIFAFGNSMGAFLTIAVTAAEPSAFVAAAITAGGIVPTAGFAAPTVETARGIRAPILILHGSDDPVVPPERSALLEETLRAAGVPCERHLFPGVAHQLIGERRDEVNELVLAWFARFDEKSRLR